MRLFTVSAIFLSLAIAGSAQRRAMTAAEWKVEMVGEQGAPIFKTRCEAPCIETIRNAYFDGNGKSDGEYSIVIERVDRYNYRMITRNTRNDAPVPYSERILLDRVYYMRSDPTGAFQRIVGNPPGPTVVRPDPAASPWVRKTGYRETEYFSLGTRHYKGISASVFENVTRHALINKKDDTQLHIERRYTTWLGPGKQVLRFDTQVTNTRGSKVTRTLSSHEYERNAAVAPLEVSYSFNPYRLIGVSSVFVCHRCKHCVNTSNS